MTELKLAKFAVSQEMIDAGSCALGNIDDWYNLPMQERGELLTRVFQAMYYEVQSKIFFPSSAIDFHHGEWTAASTRQISQG